MGSLATVLALSLAKSTPLLLSGFGGLLSELSGVINFALEGMMLLGAFCAVGVTYLTGSPWLGLLAGSCAGAGLGLLHVFFSLRLRANQIVSAIALNIFASGVTGMLLNQLFGVYGTSPAVQRLPVLAETPLAALPWVGAWLSHSVLGGLSIAIPGALALVSLTALVLGRSVAGLRLRACGENPDAAEAAGIKVWRVRLAAVLASGVLAGLGGAYLAVGELAQFVENMTHGRGYLAIAALILGRWRASGLFAAALFFGFADALSEWSAVLWPQLPSQLLLALPYLLCLTVLTTGIGRREPPSARGRL